MKKGIITFAAVLSLVLVTGCGSKNQVVCSGKVDDGDDSYEAKMVANLKDGKVSDGYIEMTYNDKKTVETMCKALDFTNSMAKDDKDKVDFKCNGKTIRINTLEMDEDDKYVGLSKDEFIKKASGGSANVTCK